VLDGLHPARAEALAVADAIDLVDDRRRHVAGEQEIRVQRMRHPAFDGARGGDQRLPDDLAAEDAAAAEIRRLSAKEVQLELLEVELADEALERGIHVRATITTVRVEPC